MAMDGFDEKEENLVKTRYLETIVHITIVARLFFV